MLLSNHGSALTDCAAARHTLPRLASLLRHGCRGAAPTVSRALLPLAALLPLELFTLVDRSEGVGTSALPPAVALLDSIWEGLGSTSLPQAHIKEMMRAYGEILMLLLVRSSEGGKLKEGTVGLLSVGLLRHSMGKPIMALLTGKLPTKLNDAEVIEGIAAVAAQLAASTRCAAALTPYWREITETCAAMCTGAGPIGRPPTAAVRPAAALLAAIDAQLSQRQDSAPAAMQVRTTPQLRQDACLITSCASFPSTHLDHSDVWILNRAPSRSLRTSSLADISMPPSPPHRSFVDLDLLLAPFALTVSTRRHVTAHPERLTYY